jgi:hypothetical protein
VYEPTSPAYVRLCLPAVLALIAVSAPAASATGIAGHVRVAIDKASSHADFSKTAARNSFVILNGWEGARARSLKARNPALRVLMYKNLSFMSRARYGRVNTGVSLAEAGAHPSWYLRSRGRPFTSQGYQFMWAADIGRRSYQRRWSRNVLRLLRESGWDGVFVDDVNTTISHHYDAAAVDRYPSDASYSAATGRALAAIGPKLRAAGKLVIANFGSWRLHRLRVNRWLDFVSGGMEEQFTKWGTAPGTGYAGQIDWELQLAAEKDAEAKGKYFLGVAHSTSDDRAAARYGWATALLGAAGHTAFIEAADYTNQPWFPEYDYKIGDPASAETADGNGVHRRAFADGLVVVNPTPGTVTVDFGGPYNGSGLTNATGATMGPSTALILTKADSSLFGQLTNFTTGLGTPGRRKSPGTRGFLSAPKRTRTSTGQMAHKALNLARLPIPPPARGGGGV